MNTDSTYRITLHVLHPSLPASEIEDSFRLRTRFSQSVGEPRKTKSNKPLCGVYKLTNVSFLFHEAPQDFEEVSLNKCIKNLLDTFDKNFIKTICNTGGSINFLIGVFCSTNVMFEIDTEIIHQLAKLNISLKFDFYGGEE